ncbi:hypothetical protein G20c_31 [Thermus phage G20c]|nr:hypothetical protein G20c_31 [Thermus phage G20c]
MEVYCNNPWYIAHYTRTTYKVLDEVDLSFLYRNYFHSYMYVSDRAQGDVAMDLVKLAIAYASAGLLEHYNNHSAYVSPSYFSAPPPSLFTPLKGESLTAFAERSWETELALGDWLFRQSKYRKSVVPLPVYAEEDFGISGLEDWKRFLATTGMLAAYAAVRTGPPKTKESGEKLLKRFFRLATGRELIYTP